MSIIRKVLAGLLLGLVLAQPVVTNGALRGVFTSPNTSPAGNVVSYGADPTCTIDSAPAINAAIAANDYVYLPKGCFLVNSQITITRPAVTIEGANPDWIHLGVNQGGTLINLGAAAGSGAAAFAWTGAGAGADYGGLVISRLGIRLNNAGLKQIGIRISQALNTRIQNVTIIGQGTTSDDTVGIQFDGLVGPYQYSGDINIQSCYIANHLIGINVQGVVTTFAILNTNLNGSAGHATSTGVLIGNGGNTNNGTAAQVMVGFSIIGSQIVQWHTGIQSWGQQIRQQANYFEQNTPAVMGGNYAISAITQANPAVVTLSTVSTTHPLATSNLAISGISQAASAVVTLSSAAVSNPLSVNVPVNFSGVVGMTQINGLASTVAAVGGSSGAWTATVPINSSAFTAYSSGGNVGYGAAGNAVNPTGIVGMTQMNGLQGVISAIGGISGAWTVTLGGVNSFGGIDSTAFTAYGSGGTLGTAQNFNWVRGITATSTQNSSVYDLFVTGTTNFPQTSTDGNVFLGPSTTYLGSLDSTASQGQVLFFNNHLLSPAVKLVYDGNTLSASVPFYNSQHPISAFTMNGGSNFGQIQQITAAGGAGNSSWGLGYGASQTVLGTSALSWTDAGAVTMAAGPVSINASANNATSIGTGTTTSNVSIGNGANLNVLGPTEITTGTLFTAATATGCATTNGTPGTLAGGPQSGTFVGNSAGAGCTIVLTINGATGKTAAHSWHCFGSDITTGVALAQKNSSATTCTLFGTLGAITDTISWGATAD
jgi:hypothetical protein